MKTREIYVDIDRPYRDYVNDGQPSAAIDALDMWLGARFKLFIRTSPNKRVHLKIVPDTPVPVWVSFQIRAILHDDPFRLRQDLARLRYTGDVQKTGRIFDEKFIDGKVKRAGKWVELTP